MIDLHTHILCGMDDGASDPEVSLEMLRMEKMQGVNTVVLTPHFYRSRERVGSFLRRRKEALACLQDQLDRLPEEKQSDIPQIVIGAEVAWVPNLSDCEDLDQLCLGQTKNMLLELPYTKWDASLGNQIYDLMQRTGITPVLAHLERYLKLQKPEQIEDVLSLNLPVQISAEGLLHITSRGRCFRALRQWAHLVASDCHDTTGRRPNLGDAMDVITRKLGPEAAEAINENALQLIR